MIDASRSLLITGATGTLGRACARLCELRGLSHVLTTRQQLDVADPASVAAAFDEIRPWAIINTAGYVRVDDAESDFERCRRENADGPALLAAVCAARDVPLLTFSSDLVFDGEKKHPYLESDAIAPLNVYGQTKAEGETRVLTAWPRALVIRTSAFFGPWDDFNFLAVMTRSLATGTPFTAASDLVISPTYVPDLVNASLDLLIDQECGIWHLANPDAVTWLEFARSAASVAGLDQDRIEGRPAADLGLVARRPRYSVLGSERGELLPPLESAIERYFGEAGLPHV